MNILWVATKPPWPPVDGGRVLLAHTLEALCEVDHDVTLVAPAGTSQAARADAGPRTLTSAIVEAAPTAPPWALLRRLLTGRPLTLARHTIRAVREEVARRLRERRFDVVVAEQLQGLAQCGPAADRGLPVVLRAQNVESDLWRQAALNGRRLLKPWLLREARRLAAWEAAALRWVAATLALTVEDEARLRELGGPQCAVHRVPSPFPVQLPAGDPLPGRPAVVLFGSQGWTPNAEGARWFLSAVWPRVRSELPQAQLHVFGAQDPAFSATPGLVAHAAPTDSRCAFAAGAVLAVPLMTASGVRIRILEAWARGLPVIATPAAARGLGAEDGRELLLAADEAGFVTALASLARHPQRVAVVARAGRDALAARHAPERVAARLTELLGDLTFRDQSSYT